MLKLYCQKCGGLNAYISEKPNFCQKCGSPLSSNAASIAAQASVAAPNQVEEEEIQDEKESVPLLNGLDIEIEPFADLANSTPKLSDIVGTSKGEEYTTTQHQSELSGLDEFKMEARSIKGPQPEDIPNEKKET